MADLDRLLRNGLDLPPPPQREPRLWPFVAVAAGLVALSVGIAVFWPMPKSAPLPACADTVQQDACVRRSNR